MQYNSAITVPPGFSRSKWIIPPQFHQRTITLSLNWGMVRVKNGSPRCLYNRDAQIVRVVLYSSPIIDVGPIYPVCNSSDFVKMSSHCWPNSMKSGCYFLDTHYPFRLVILKRHYQILRVVHFDHYRTSQNHHCKIF